jgi:hypothetical protein
MKKTTKRRAKKHIHPYRKPLPAYEVHCALQELAGELIVRANSISGPDLRKRNLWLSIAREVQKLEPHKLVDYPLLRRS